MGWICAVCGAIALLTATDTAAQTPSRPPVEAFGALPDLSRPVLSPDGKHVAVFQSIDGRPVLVIYTVGAGADAKPVVRTFSDWIFSDLSWAKNDRLIVYVTKDQKLGWNYQNANRLETFGRAISVDPTGNNVLVLFRHNVAYAENINMSGVTDTDLDDPDNVYIPYSVRSDLLSPAEQEMRSKNGNEDDADLYRYDMFKVNVRTGDDTRVVAGDYTTQEWYMDGHGHVLARLDRGRTSLEEHLKIFDNGEWREFNRSTPRAVMVSGYGGCPKTAKVS